MTVFDRFVVHRACLVLKRRHCFYDYIFLNGKFTFVLGWMIEEKMNVCTRLDDRKYNKINESKKNVCVHNKFLSLHVFYF